MTDIDIKLTDEEMYELERSLAPCSVYGYKCKACINYGEKWNIERECLLELDFEDWVKVTKGYKNKEE